MKKVKLLNVESDVRLLYHREDTPLHIKSVLDEVMLVFRGMTEFTSNVLNIIDDKYYKAKSDLYELKGMDRLVRLNDKQLLDDIRAEIEELDRKF